MMLFKISMMCVWALCVCFMLYKHSKRISELERRTADHDSKLYNEVVRGAKNTKMLKATSAAVDAIAEDLKNTRRGENTRFFYNMFVRSLAIDSLNLIISDL